MSRSKPYHPTPDELRAIDEGLLDVGGPPLSDAELRDFWRREAAQFRARANVAETVEMRVELLEFAEYLERMAARAEAGEPPDLIPIRRNISL